MKFKFKINNTTSIKDVKDELNFLKSANVKRLPLNHLLKIIKFLGAEQVPSTGSSIRFEHHLLKQHKYFNGFFKVDKIDRSLTNHLS